MEEQQPSYRAIYFQVTDGAQAEMMGGMPILYVGVSYHIPRAAIEEAQRVFTETQDPAKAQAIIARDDMEPNSLLGVVRDRGYHPMDNAILERFDTVDSTTGDILVLLRVPCAMEMLQEQGGDLPKAA